MSLVVVGMNDEVPQGSLGHMIVNSIKIASDDINFAYEIGAEIIKQLSQVFIALCRDPSTHHLDG